MRKTIFAVLAITLVALTIGCSKDDAHKDPEIPASGYTSIEDLKEKVADDWIANLAVGDIDDFCFAEYRLAGKEPCYIQLTGTFDESGPSYVLDTLNILDWGIEENYEGYSDAGLSGDAVRINFEDSSTVYLMVNSVSADSLKCSTAYKGKSAAVNFFRESQLSSYFDVVASSTAGVKSSLAEDDEQTKAGGLTATPRGIDNANWMLYVRDTTKLAYMSIPGTHDATTYNVQDELAFAARSQEKSLSQQWDCGVRAFDLRMRKEVFTSYMYHDFISCNMTFEDALKEIWNKVKANPEEGAVVILCPEGNGFVNNVGWWGTVITTAVNLLTQFGFHMSDLSLHDLETVEDVVKTINAVVPQNNIAHYDPDMTMGDLRGKILFIARSENWRWYDIGARADSWGANKEIYYKGKDGTVQKSIITVQDNYGPDEGESNGDYISEKRSDFKKMWEENCFSLVNESYHNPTLVVNQASGFVLDQAFPDYLSACNDLYNDFSGYISARQKGRGIILQDYAGRGETKRISAGAAEACAAVAFAIPLLPRKLMLKAYLALAELAASEKETYGQKLVDAVIDNNFKSREGYNVKIEVRSSDESIGTVDINGTGQKSVEVPYGERVTLKAYPKEGYYFGKWTDSKGETVSLSQDFDFRVESDDETYTALFGSPIKVVLVAESGCEDMCYSPYLRSDLIIVESRSWAGEVIKRSEYTLVQGVKVELICQTQSGYEVVQWADSKGNIYDPDECKGIKLNNDETFTVKLKVKDNSKKINVRVAETCSGNGEINVSEVIDGNVYPLEKGYGVQSFSKYFGFGETYHIEAVGKNSKAFLYWTDSQGNRIPDRILTGTMTTDLDYTAWFSAADYKVTASLAAGSGPDWGTVSVGSDGYDWMYFMKGDKSTLTATPAPGYSFVEWRNKATGEEFKDNPLTVTVEDNTDYIAYFAKEVTDDMFNGSIFIVGDNKYIQFMKGFLTYEDGEPMITEDPKNLENSWFSWYYDKTSVTKKMIDDYVRPNIRTDKPIFADKLFTSGGKLCRILSYDDYCYIATHYKCHLVTHDGIFWFQITLHPVTNNTELDNNGKYIGYYDDEKWAEEKMTGSVFIPLIDYVGVGRGNEAIGFWLGDARYLYHPQNYNEVHCSDMNYYSISGASVWLVREVEP